MSKKRLNPRRFEWHGLINHPLYNVFYNIKKRCEYSHNQAYKNYGGRGIRCLFPSFKEFYEWAMASGYKSGLTIDRINNDGHYKPANCRWVTRVEQNKNRRDNKRVMFRGELMIVSDACRSAGMRTSTFWERVRRGWSMERAISQGVPN